MLSSKEALECIIWRLSSLNDDLEPRETEKKEIDIIKQALERLEVLETSVETLKHKVKKYKHTNDQLKRGLRQQRKENEKLKKAIIDILEYVKCELDSIEIVDRIENILNEVLNND